MVNANELRRSWCEPITPALACSAGSLSEGRRNPPIYVGSNPTGPSKLMGPSSNGRTYGFQASSSTACRDIPKKLNTERKLG